MRYIFIALLFFFIVSCKVSHDSGQSRWNKNKSNKNDSIALQSDKNIEYDNSLDTVVLVKMKRTACFGKCPQYEVTLFASGLVTYKGIAHSSLIGSYKSKVAKKEIDLIFTKANECNYFNFSDKYPTNGNDIVDFPVCITQLNYNGKSKSIFNRNDAPKELVFFEKYLDNFFSSLNWSVSENKN
jgi:hypothetical protein